MRSKNILRGAYIALAIILTGELAALPPARAGGAPEMPILGTRPAAIHAIDITGKPLSLDSYRGRVVLLDYWTTGCPMCRPEQTNVLRSYQALHSHGLEVIGISLDDRLSTAGLFATASGSRAIPGGRSMTYAAGTAPSPLPTSSIAFRSCCSSAGMDR